MVAIDRKSYEVLREADALHTKIIEMQIRDKRERLERMEKQT